MRLGLGLHVKEVLGDAAFAFLDRVLVSATNFAVGILLIRRAAEAEYGLYVLAYSAILLIIGFQNALITTPMSVMAPRQETIERQTFVSTLGKTQYLVWIPLCLAAALFSHMGTYLHIDRETSTIILAVAVVGLSIFLQEFMRQAFFVYMAPRAVLCVDIVYGVVFLGIVYCFTATSSAPAVYTITAMGLAGLLGGMAGFVLFRRSIGWKASWDLSPLMRTWRHGRWALLGVAVTWLHSQGFLYLLSGFKGVAEVASVSASRLLFMPIPMMLVSMGSILKPRGSAWIADGEEKRLLGIIAMLIAGVGVFSLAYSSMLLLGQKKVETLVFGKEIPDMNSLLLLWGAVFLVQVVRSGFSILLQILELFKALFYVGALAAGASLTLGYWAIHAFGTPGSVVGLIAGEAVYVVCMGWVYCGERRRRGSGIKSVVHELTT